MCGSLIDIYQYLKNKFGFLEFRQGQEKTIKSLIEGKDTLTVLPTGAGKSLCYQFTSYYKNNGQTVIVSPLISLMEDQVSLLRKMGEKSVVSINSLLSYESRRYVYERLGTYRFIFISPEALSVPETLAHFKKLKISLLVVDESHCISKWGHDFRPSYLDLKNIKKALGSPLTLALTATATESVKKDIAKQLFLGSDYEEIAHSVNRKNIYYEVVSTTDKIPEIVSFLREDKGSGIIYFSSKKEAERVSQVLSEEYSLPASFYHGDLSSEDRIRVQQQFINNKIKILCATSAFGMGINKPDIRFVIHYHLPDSIENFMQESGRAGRDGKQSISLVFYQNGDEQIHFYLNDQTFQQKQEILFLKNKEKEVKQQLTPMLSDIQKKWIEQLENNALTWDEFEKTSETKKHQHNTQLFSVLELIQSDSCKRSMLAEYFQEDRPKEQEYCCSSCDSSRPLLHISENDLLKDEILFDPIKKLKKIFSNHF